MSSRRDNRAPNWSRGDSEIDRAREALSFIPSNCCRTEWVRVGMAAKAAGLSFEDFNNWSATADNYKNERDVAAVWKSFEFNGGIGAGTLFQRAATHGYRLSPEPHASTARLEPRRTEKPAMPRNAGSAADVWARCKEAPEDHGYIVAKQGRPAGLRVVPQGDPLVIRDERMAGWLAVPVSNTLGEIIGLQFIAPPNIAESLAAKEVPSKLNLRGASIAGTFIVGELEPAGIVYVVEGIGTAWACWTATGRAAVVCFGWGMVRARAKELRDRDPAATVVIVPDVGKEADALEIAREVGGKVAPMPEGWPNNSDMADLGLRDGLDAVEDLLAKATEPSPPVPTVEATPRRAIDEPMAGIVCAAMIHPEPVKWLWDGWLAAGKLHILAGAPGTGKTTVALAFAATVSCAGRWPDGTTARLGQVLIWSSEDDAKDTLVPRLIAMGADLNRVHFIQTADDGERIRSFDPATDMAQLRATIRHLGISPDLLIVDPIVSAVAGDSHKGSETRRSLQPLVDLGVAEQCAVLGISHFSKGTAGRDVVERVTGSLAFGALARLVFAAAKMPDDQGGGRFIARAKSNLGPDGGGYRYELQQHALTNHPGIQASTLLWGEVIEGNARDILAQAEALEDIDTKSQTDEAQDWLCDLLRDGPVKANDAIKKGRAAGLSEKSLRAARERLGVKPRKQAYSGGWMWSLPHAQDAQRSQDAQGAQPLSLGTLGAFDGAGHLRKPNGNPDSEY